MAGLFHSEANAHVILSVGGAGDASEAPQQGERIPRTTRPRRSCSWRAALGLLAVGALLLLGASGRPLIEAAQPEAQDGETAEVAADPEAKSAELAALCTVDTRQAALCLTRAVALLHNATLSCSRTERRGRLAVRGEQRDTRQECSVDVGVAAGSAAWTAAYVAATLKSCTAKEHLLRQVHAACASSFAGLVAELTDIAFVAGAVVDACEQDDSETQHGPHHDRHLWQEGRFGHLAKAPSEQCSAVEELELLEERADKMKEAARTRKQHRKGPQHEEKQRGLGTAQCVVDVNVGTAFLARAGLQIHQLHNDSSLLTDLGREHSVLDVSRVISSVAWATRYLSQVFLDCPGMARSKGACTAVVANFVAIATTLGATINNVKDHCPLVPLLSGASVNGTDGPTSPIGHALFAH